MDSGAIAGSHRKAQMEVWIGYTLLGGVLLSAALLTGGLLWGWASTGHLLLDYALPRTNFLKFLTLETREALQGIFRPRLLVNLGIVVLMLTPYIRVFFSMVYFACVERNWKYALFTGFVLATLTYSFLLR